MKRSLKFSRLSDIKEGRGSRGPRPSGWVDRFNKRVDRKSADDCWLWRGYIGNHGYGVLSICNVPVEVHRLAFLLAHGHINPDLLVMHSCDNRRCVNSAHLSQGTDADNVADALQKDRMQKGETNGMAKLTEKQVIDIRHRYWNKHFTVAALADIYGVWPSCISRIINGTRWKHIA